MKYLFVVTFIIVYIGFGANLGYTETSPVWRHFTYMFCHAGTIHLTINAMAFIAMFRVLEKSINKWKLAATIITIGFIASYLAIYDIPTVGASGMIYAMIGSYFALIVCRKLIIKERKKLLIFSIAILLCLSVSFYKTNSNFRLHIFSLILGFISQLPITMLPPYRMSTLI